MIRMTRSRRKRDGAREDGGDAGEHEERTGHLRVRDEPAEEPDKLPEDGSETGPESPSNSGDSAGCARGASVVVASPSNDDNGADDSDETEPDHAEHAERGEPGGLLLSVLPDSLDWIV